VEALLAPLRVRYWRGEAAQLEAEARDVADLAHTASDPSGIGRTQFLLGDVLQTKGRLNEALAAFREAFAIFQHLAATAPSNAAWQRDLALAHNKLGQAYQGMGNEENAQSSYRSAVDAMERAVAMSPGTVGWKQALDHLKSWLSSG